MKTTLKVLESTWIYFLVSFYDPTNSHTYFGQKIFTIRWIATVVELGGFDFTSAFILLLFLDRALEIEHCFQVPWMSRSRIILIEPDMVTQTSVESSYLGPIYIKKPLLLWFKNPFYYTWNSILYRLCCLSSTFILR